MFFACTSTTEEKKENSASTHILFAVLESILEFIHNIWEFTFSRVFPFFLLQRELIDLF